MVVVVDWWGQSRGGPSGGGGINFFSHCKMFVMRHVRRTVIFNSFWN
jgi:hypothetical protein